MLARALPGENACDVLGLRHAAAAQRARRCERRLQQIGLQEEDLNRNDLTRHDVARHELTPSVPAAPALSIAAQAASALISALTQFTPASHALRRPASPRPQAIAAQSTAQAITQTPAVPTSREAD